MDESKNKLVIFRGKEIRRMWHEDEWYYSVVDICGVLTDSADSGAYWRKLKQRLKQEGSEVVTICHGLKLEAPDGKKRVTDCSNTKGIFRIIQSIPSKKAEPFKQWLAQLGKERLDEIENPELAQQRMEEIYEKKGYPQDWIDKRLSKYIESGVSELDQDKLPSLLELKYHSITDAAEALGGVESIKNTFIEFQKYLYQMKAA